MISKVFLVLIIVTLAFAFPKTNAQSSTDTCGTWKFDCYKESGFRLTSDPVICMELPSDRNMVAKMRAYVEDAVMDWENKLNANSPSAWNIQLLTTGMSDACNISIQFIAKPTLDQQGGISDAVGVTRFFTDHTAQIEIFYNAIDDGGNFLDSQAPDYQIQWTIKHELGHAFGLDHYMMTDEKQKDWLTGLTPTPSIMIQIVPSAFSVTGTWITYPPIVTYKDIAQLKSLYNNNGFGGQARTTFPSMQSSTTQQISIDTDKQVYYYGDHVTITINVSQVTGANATLTLTTGGSQTGGVPIPLVISELQTRITSPYALNETNSPTGTIEARLSYDGQTTSTSFQIAGQTSSSSTLQDQTNSNVPTTITPIPSGVKHNAYYWAMGDIGDDGFVKVLQWLDFENDISIQQSSQEPNSQTIIPSWVKKDAKLWSQGDMTDSEFSTVIQYLLDNKIIVLSQ